MPALVPPRCGQDTPRGAEAPALTLRKVADEGNSGRLDERFPDHLQAEHEAARLGHR